MTAKEKFARDFFILYRLAEMGACQKAIKVSTRALARALGLSQQSVSRRLIDLERNGLIHRTITSKGSLIRISEEGERRLRKIYFGLDTIFGKKMKSIIIEGKVFSGLGEGAYYVSKKMYRKQFIEKLGFDPYPGTLNLKLLRGQNMDLRAKLDVYPGIEVEGFRNKDRSYGPVKCFHAVINDKERGAVVLALRSHYGRDVIEVIAPTYLREKLGLKDGDKVKVEIFL